VLRAELAHHLEQRHHQRNQRKHRDRQKQRHDEVAMRHPQARQRVGGQRADEHAQRGGQPGDDEAVPHEAQDRLRGERGLVVGERRRIGQVRDRAADQLGLGLERGQQNPDGWEKPVDGDDDCRKPHDSLRSSFISPPQDPLAAPACSAGGQARRDDHRYANISTASAEP
jgi:hypothetical protein